MWHQHKFFKYALGILLVLLIIFMLGQIDFFFTPFRKILSALLLPLLISGLLYYVFRPPVRLLEERKIPRTFAILITFIGIIAVFAVISTYTGSIVGSQFRQLTDDLPRIYQSAREKTTDIMNNGWMESLSIGNIEERAMGFLEQATKSLSQVLVGILSTITNIGAALVIVPFILFYFLKDDDKFSSSLLRAVPRNHKDNFKKIIKDIDSALSSYILGQLLVALAIGILMFIGYIIIGIKYSFVLAFFAMITSIIPFFGPWIGILPAILVGLTENPFMVVKVLIVMIVVQQLDGNLISPNIMGKRLDIHPLTILLLLLAGVSLFGFIGLVVIIPLYAATKATVKNIYTLYGSRQNRTEKL